MMINSFRIFSQICVNDAVWNLLEGLPSKRKIYFLDGNGNRVSAILWHSPVSLFFQVDSHGRRQPHCCLFNQIQPVFVPNERNPLMCVHDNKTHELCQGNFVKFFLTAFFIWMRIIYRSLDVLWVAFEPINSESKKYHASG